MHYAPTIQDFENGLKTEVPAWRCVSSACSALSIVESAKEQTAEFRGGSRAAFWKAFLLFSLRVRAVGKLHASTNRWGPLAQETLFHRSKVRAQFKIDTLTAQQVSGTRKNLYCGNTASPGTGNRLRAHIHTV
jgi:hypothetical protein